MPTILNESPTQIPTEYDYSSMYKSPNGIALHKEWFEQKLASFAEPYERLLVDTSFGPSHVLAVGPKNAPPLILVPGAGGCSIESWRDQLTYFSQAQTHRVYALDVVGHSPASAPTKLSTTNLDYGIWMLEVLSGLGVRRADFAALISGCGMLIKLANYAPSRINSAIFINPATLVKVNFDLGRYLTVMLAINFPTEGNIRRMWRDMCAPQTRLDEILTKETIEFNQFTCKYLKFSAFSETFTDEQLQKLAFPCLLVLGQHVKLYNIGDIINKMQRNVSRLSVEVAPNAGFAIETEIPEYLTHSLANYLRYVATYFGPPTIPA